jgi:hypothetical protein
VANRKRFQLKVAEEVVDFEGLFLTGRPSREIMGKNIELPSVFYIFRSIA